MSSLRHRKTNFEAEVTPPRPIFKNVAAVDLFPKPKEDYCRTQTYQGAIVSLLTVIVMSILVLWEVTGYLFGRDAFKTELSIDTKVSEKVLFNIDITFPKVSCHEVSLIVLDATGTFKFNVTRNIQKLPVTSNGEIAFAGNLDFLQDSTAFQYDPKKDHDSPEYCGDCFINEEYKYVEKDNKMCCNSCEDVMKIHDKHGFQRPSLTTVKQCMYELSLTNPGCNFKGSLKLKKVSGMLVFAPKRDAYGFKIKDVMQFDASHIVKKFSIGDERVSRFSRRGVYYPLNDHSFDAGGRFAEVKYYLKIVPTGYFTEKGNEVLGSTYEYSVQWSYRFIPIGFGYLPSVSYTFDFSPIQVNNYFKRPPLYHVLVQLCGIVGGLFVVLGMIDTLVMRISRFFRDF
ncbi:Endoplasmic reticulum vesicle transporter [Trypanosoma melophagium]|uniref:Endoplasmic reticulum vesicle transporter n=1 Tax=Trypanosoma melophagium TaxID=715481 RepID=UPI00351A75DB|nr:Endoplasmic reticulum vesicle transporter [Trypanosoma melophagium]